MKDDLLARLRAKYDPKNMRRFGPINPNGPEAATYIEQLTAENERLREALEPFSEAARMAGIGGASVTGGHQWRSGLRTACKFVTIEHFGRANVEMHRTALKIEKD